MVATDKNVSCVVLAFYTCTCTFAAWTTRLGGSHWLVARLLISWLLMHDLEERGDVRASNIEFARAAAVCARELVCCGRLTATGVWV